MSEDYQHCLKWLWSQSDERPMCPTESRYKQYINAVIEWVTILNIDCMFVHVLVWWLSVGLDLLFWFLSSLTALTRIFMLNRSLVEEFRKTLCSLWQGSQTAFSPDSLFYTIWKIMPSFRYVKSSIYISQLLNNIIK